MEKKIKKIIQVTITLIIFFLIIFSCFLISYSQNKNQNLKIIITGNQYGQNLTQHFYVLPLDYNNYEGIGIIQNFSILVIDEKNNFVPMCNVELNCINCSCSIISILTDNNGTYHANEITIKLPIKIQSGSILFNITKDKYNHISKESMIQRYPR